MRSTAAILRLSATLSLTSFWVIPHAGATDQNAAEYELNNRIECDGATVTCESTCAEEVAACQADADPAAAASCRADEVRCNHECTIARSECRRTGTLQ